MTFADRSGRRRGAASSSCRSGSIRPINAWCVAFARALEHDLRRGAARRRDRLLLGDGLLRSAARRCGVARRARSVRAAAAVHDRGCRRAAPWSTCRSATAASSAPIWPTSRRSADARRTRSSRSIRRVSIASTWSASFPASPTWPRSIRDRRAAPSVAADGGAGRLGGDRRRADRHLSGGHARRLEHHRPHAARSRTTPIAAEPFLFQPGDRVRFHRDRLAASSIAGVRLHDHDHDRPRRACSRPFRTSAAGGIRRAAFRWPGRWTRTRTGWRTGSSATIRRAAALEITLIGPELEADGDVVCAVAGAPFELIGGRRGRRRCTSRSRFVPARACASGSAVAGARATLAVRGGFDVPPVFGSRATSLSARWVRSAAAPLRAGDVLPIGRGSGVASRGRRGRDVAAAAAARRRAAPGHAGAARRDVHADAPRDALRRALHDHARSRIAWAIGSRARRSRTRDARTSCPTPRRSVRCRCRRRASRSC